MKWLASLLLALAIILCEGIIVQGFLAFASDGTSVIRNHVRSPEERFGQNQRILGADGVEITVTYGT